jgi:DNA modification methylase
LLKGDANIKVAQEAYNLVQSLGIIDQIWWGANFYCSTLKDRNSWIVWDKKTVGESYSDCELAYTTRKGRIIKFIHQWHGMIKASEQGQKRVHPTQKPIELAKFGIGLFDNIINVLDLFAGSGSTLIACINTKRNCYTCDIDEHYTQVTVKRAVDFMNKNDIEFHITLNGKEFNIDRLNA